MIGCEDRLRNDLYCVGWGIKLYSIQTNLGHDLLHVKFYTLLQTSPDFTLVVRTLELYVLILFAPFVHSVFLSVFFFDFVLVILPSLAK